MKNLLGFDIGGTKCAAVYGQYDGGRLIIRAKNIIETADYESSEEVLAQLVKLGRQLAGDAELSGVGVTCGGPLDSRRGLILSPPNLIGWDEVPVTQYLAKEFGVPAYLQNDANACAIAEWKFGAGQGYGNLVFLTFGTGLGAGLILNNRLYTGCCDMAGEIGHVRLENYGPVGYGKSGSAEGFCSGGGIAQLAQLRLNELLQQGKHHPLENEPITAKAVFELAKRDDPLCLDICAVVGQMFGRALSILIDLLNPEVIIAGSIFARNFDLLYPLLCESVGRESLRLSRQHCKILPAALGESIGDIASLAVALHQEEEA